MFGIAIALIVFLFIVLARYERRRCFSPLSPVQVESLSWVHESYGTIEHLIGEHVDDVAQYGMFALLVDEEVDIVARQELFERWFEHSV